MREPESSGIKNIKIKKNMSNKWQQQQQQQNANTVLIIFLWMNWTQQKYKNIKYKSNVLIFLLFSCACCFVLLEFWFVIYFFKKRKWLFIIYFLLLYDTWAEQMISFHKQVFGVVAVVYQSLRVITSVKVHNFTEKGHILFFFLSSREFRKATF